MPVIETKYCVPFQGSLDLPHQNELMVKIFAGIDVVNQMVIWEFQAIDTKTGNYVVL